MSTILVVDDERLLVETIACNLRREGFEVLQAADGETALQRVREAQPDLVILDLMLPRVSGWEVCRALRREPEYGLHIPILMLTARGEESDRVVGLEMGADDYLVKPFGMRELIARVRALLRRGAPAVDTGSRLECGNVVLDQDRYEVHVRGEDGTSREVNLSRREFELLHALMRKPGQALRRRQLLEQVWGEDFFGDERTLDVHIRWLREKVEADPATPRHIVTVRGVGYKFKVD